MFILSLLGIHKQVQSILPTAMRRDTIRDGYGNEVEAEISAEMRQYIAENELPEDVPELATGLDNEAVADVSSPDGEEPSPFKPL